MTFVKNVGYTSGGYYTCDAPTAPCKATLTTTMDIIDSGWGRKFSESDVWFHYCPNHLVYSTNFSRYGIEPDPINHPAHYTSHPSGVECIDIIKYMDLRLGLVFKHLWRAGLKDGNPTLQDLRKAQWYLNSKIEDLEKG